MSSVTTAAAIPELKKAGWSLDIQDTGIECRHGKKVYFLKYTDSLGSLVEGYAFRIALSIMRQRNQA